MLNRKIYDNFNNDIVENLTETRSNFPYLNDKDYGQSKNKINWLDVNDWFVIEVKMQNLTEYGNPFQPRFLKLREDKEITECVYNERKN